MSRTATARALTTQQASVACYVCARTFEAPTDGYSGELGDLCHDCMARLIDIVDDHLNDAAMQQTPDDPKLATMMERAIGFERTRLTVLLLVATGKLLCRVDEASGELEFTTAYGDEPRPALLS